ncbi:hypothetical protein [Halocatena marina]|nr:hypothetical protein [Halocatena marina]
MANVFAREFITFVRDEIVTELVSIRPLQQRGVHYLSVMYFLQ